MLKKDLKCAGILVNQLINETIELFSNDRDFLVRHAPSSCDMCLVIQPTYSPIFYSMGKFIQIAVACGCSYYVKAELNMENVYTPTLHIY